MFNVIIEYKNGNVIQGQVSEGIWFGLMYRELEEDNSVVHYTVDRLDK